MSAYVPYPSLDDPNFNGTLARKKEFNIVDAQSTPTGFTLTPSQKRVRNFLSPSTPYNGILLFHATGTGKTCSAITIAEQFSDAFTKKHFVLLPSSTLKDNFRQQIFDAAKIQVANGTLNLEDIPTCTGDRYVRVIPNNKALDRDAIADKVKKIVNDRWQFRGYLEFANEYDRQREAIAKTESNPERAQRRFERYLKNTYSNRVFIMDEAHNLRTAAEATKKLVPPKVEHVLRIAENVKLILLSATPMFDSATEIVYLINLLRLNDKLPPIAIEDIFSPRKGLTTKGRQNLIAATRGYVSFLPVDNPKAFPMRLYPFINKDSKVMRARDFPTTDFFGKDFTHEFNPEHIVVSRFGEYQRRAYEAMRPKRATKKMQDAADAKVQVLMQVSNVAFPVEDGEAFHGDKLFDKCFQSKSATGRVYDPAVLKKHGQFLAPDSISNYAAKIKSIVDYILSSEGVVYVYSSFVYSGILPLAIALEHVGYRKYGGNNVLADATTGAKKRGAYVILSANKEFSPNNDAEIATSKSPQNVNGDVIKVIIASNVASEGVDFKYIREVHIMEPWYNYNKMEQIIGRAIRQYSHENLPLEKRNVTIYQHANLLPDKETIDLYAYRLAETKDALMSQVEDVLKSNAIDCLLATPSKPSAKEKVVTSQGVETSLSATSTTTKSKQSCLGATTKPTQPDASTFTKSFLTTEIYELKKHIKRAFQKYHVFTFDSLAEAVRPTDREAFMYALDEVIKDRERVMNRDNLPGYVLYRSDKYLFQPAAAKDTRLLIEDRDPEVLQTQNFGRNKINLKQLQAAQQPSLSQTRPQQPLQTQTQQHTPQTQAQQPRRLLIQIEESIQKLLKYLMPQEAPGFTQAACDYVIDRLTPQEHMDLLQRYESLPVTIQTSFKTSLGVYFENNVPKYYTDASTEYKDGNPFYTLSTDGTFKRASRLELPQISDLAYQKQVLLKERTKTLHDVSAFVTPQVIKHRMKIVRENAKKTTGSVCASTSDFSVETMKSLIENVGNVALPPKTTKVSLCEIYELALRRFAPQKFLRPHAYALMLAKK
jgi:hypothetical protein